MNSVPFWWLGPAIGVLGILIGLVLYRIGNREKVPCYVMQTITLVGPAGALPEEIKISFKGVPVPKVTRTDVILWNAGRESIRKEDLVATDPVEVCFYEEVQILACNVVKRTHSSTLFEATIIAPNRVRLNFEHLGHGDGARVEILHTGDASSGSKIRGTIHDVRGIKRLGNGFPSLYELILPFPPRRTRLSSRRHQRLVKATVCASLILGLLTVYLGLIHETPTRLKPEFVRIEGLGIAVVGVFYVFTALVGFWGMRRRHPRQLDID